MICWILFIVLIITGLIELILTKSRYEKGCRTLSVISMGLSIAVIILLVLSRVVYGTLFAFILSLVKGSLMLYNI